MAANSPPSSTAVGDNVENYSIHIIAIKDTMMEDVRKALWATEAARWESVRTTAKQADIGKRIDDALSLIEAEKPKLKGIAA